MILHHIKLDQIATLEKLFGMQTTSGLEMPTWLRRLRETADRTTELYEEDFKETFPRLK